MMSQLPDERRSEILLTNIESADCGVIAIQAVTGLSRQAAEAVAKDKAKYVRGAGIIRGNLNRALEGMGWKLVEVANERDGFTVATFAMDHEYGKYLMYTERHVMGMVDGDCHNSRGQWHAPLEIAYHLTYPNGV